ncbi:MAG: GNAT family N-acetyltransferase [Bacteroidia bacterium]
MKAEFTINRNLSLDEMKSCFHLIQLLNPKLKERDFLMMLPEMITANYKMLGVFYQQQIIGISGYWIQTKIYSGKYLEPDNVVIATDFRSQGIGAIMMKELELIAKENHCRFLMLDAYLENQRAHEFYENLGFEKKGYHFLKKIIA